MAREWKKINEGRVRNEVSQYGVKDFQAVKRSLVVISWVLFLFGYQIVLLELDGMEGIYWASEGSRQGPSECDDKFSLTWGG